jgi:hypothetical protein
MKKHVLVMLHSLSRNYMHGVHGTILRKSSNRESAEQSDMRANVRETNRPQPAKRELRVLPKSWVWLLICHEVTASKCYCISSTRKPGTETNLARHRLVKRLHTFA